MTQLALISDTHGALPPTIPPGTDIILHAGDVGPDHGVRWWLENFAAWAEAARVPIHATLGNHDFIGETADFSDLRQKLPPNVHIHLDEAAIVEGMSIWFSPWVQNLPRWAFNISDEAYRLLLNRIPVDIDILVTHTPPFGMLDRVDSGLEVGSKVLASWLQHIRIPRRLRGVSPPTVVCGHIHEARGTYFRDGTLGLNVASTMHTWDRATDNYRLQPERWTILHL